MTVKAIVFDLDGTIASFNLDYMSVRAEARSYLIRQGIPASILPTNESIFDMLKKTEIFLKNTKKSGRALGKMRNEVSDIAEKFELEAAKTTELIPGVVETLEALKNMGIKIGICTINSEKSTNYILKRFDISKFFDAVTPRNKVKYVKPNSEHLQAALKGLKVKSQEAILVGDGARDMQCARDTNVIAVGLPSGMNSQRDLMVSGAHYFITSITEVPRLVEELNKPSRPRGKKSFLGKRQVPD